MLNCPITDIAVLLPHSGNMVFLDAIDCYDHESLTASVTLTAESLLCDNTGTIAAWMGIEILAQCIGALEGCHAHNRDEKIRLGFLLGSRKVYVHCNTLPLYQKLKAEVILSIRDSNGFAVFDCRLSACGENESDDVLLLEAALNVFSPPDISAYLADNPATTEKQSL